MIDYKAIEDFVKNNISPLLKEHCGGIDIESIKDDVLRLKLLGQRVSCPAAMDTFNDIIIEKINPAFPELKDIILVNDVPEDMLDMARKILKI